ncbi:MAG TPA: endonuclease/exonuclease/phosphatase family protein [Puia sp.]|jgi:endonuclease/exonuclease/phosphatase family metal-dependent hydrolase|nr:endonuclease/exonuclease/phosphatase family protein [Puia sp.]
MEIDLLTINTWKCDGDYYKRRKVLAAGLKQMDFRNRVIFCQECFRTTDGKVDTLNYLSEELSIPGYFVPARRKLRSLDGSMTDSFSGLGILTNLSVNSRTSVELPSGPADGGRVAQFLTLELVRGISMLAVNVHLTHLRDGLDLRIRQLESVLQETSRSTARYRIIGGDLNAAENSTEIQLLKERGTVIDCASHWVDHLFILSPAAEPYPKFACSEIVLDRPDAENGLYPSDHFGVHAHLLVPD